MDSCPTALLVDISDCSQPPKTPPTPRRTPKRSCRTPKDQDIHSLTEKLDEAIQAINKQKQAPAEDIFDKDEKENWRSSNGGNSDTIDDKCPSLLEDEQFDFDFDMSLTPSTDCSQKPGKLCPMEIEKDHDEEIFFGPVGHNEKCIARAVEEVNHEQVRPLSPLSAMQSVELFKEANIVAFHLQSNNTKYSQDSQSDIGNSPKLTNISNMPARKRKVSSLNEDEEEAVLPCPKLEVKTSRLFSPEIEKAAEPVRPKLTSTPSVTKAEPGKTLQRSASLRLPRSRLPGANASSGLSKLKPPGSRIRHASAGPKVNKDSSFSSDASSISPCDTREPPQKKRPDSAVSTSDRKLGRPPLARTSGIPAGRGIPKLSGAEEATPAGPGLTRKPSLLRGTMTKPDLMKPRKPLAATNGKSGSFLPRGPLKATAPMKAVGQNEPRSSQSNSSLQRRGTPFGGTTGPNTDKGPSQSRHSVAGGTPVKQDKSVQPKRLLPESPGITPSARQRRASGVPSSTPSVTPAPMSRLNRRRSDIPSPGKYLASTRNSSCSSNESIKSPAARRSLMSSTPQTRKENTKNSIPSPATRLASKLQPLKLVDTAHRQRNN